MITRFARCEKLAKATRQMAMLWTVTLLLQVSWCNGFNLWTKGSVPLHGANNSKFGYSVTLWSDVNSQKRIVVGAPRGQDHEEYEGYQLGNIYLCGLEGQCQVNRQLPFVETDKSKASLTAGDVMKDYGMGFGEALSTLKRDKSPLAVCAPRYSIYRKENQMVDVRSMQTRGACFVIDKDPFNPKLLVPNKTPTPKIKTVQHAMMGFSTALIDDVKTTIVMGGPLAFYEKGVVVNNPIEGGKGSLSRISNKESDPLTEDYEGWRVAQGKFDGKDTFIAASVVNFNNKGKVKFYPKNIKLDDAEKGEPNYLAEILGTAVGAKFGYSLGVGDFDGDGADDLLVGSPWSVISTSNYLPDAGKVFVYYKPLVDPNAEKAFQELHGSFAWGTFGFSTAGLGDINKDGYGEAAVGAPHAGEEGKGIVYIFSGSSDGLLSNPTQVLKASEFGGGMRGFGSSLDGGIDIDENGYPDVVIGSVDADSAVFLRSAPVVTLNGSVEVIDKTIECFTELPGYKKMKGVCFDFQVVLWYQAFNFSEDIEVDLEMVLQEQSDPPKFVFKVSNDHRYTMKLKISNRERRPKTTGITIFVKSDRTVIGNPVRVSMSVSLNPGTSIPEVNGIQVVPPVLDSLNPTTFNASMIFNCKENTTCFSNPDMSIKAYPSSLVIGEGLMHLPVLVESRNDPAYQVKVNVEHPDSLKFLRVDGTGLLPECLYKGFVHTVSTKFTCTFDHINALEKVNFTLIFEHNPLELMKFVKTRMKDLVEIKLTIQSDRDDSDPRDNVETIEINIVKESRLYTVGESSPRDTSVKVNKTLSSEDIEKALLSKSQTISPYDLGPMISQRFILTNRGPTPVLEAKLRLQLALFYEDDLMLYLLNDPFTSENVVCTWPTGTLNPWNLTDHQREGINKTSPGDKGLTQRRKRQAIKKDDLATAHPKMRNPDEVADGDKDTNYGHSTRRSRSASQEKTKYVDCIQPKCEVICEISKLEAQDHAQIYIKGFVITATLDKMKNRKIGLKSIMSAEVKQIGSIVINPQSNASTTVSLIKPRESSFQAVPDWLLAVAVFASLMLILLMVLILWKVGFFKRNRPQVPGNQQASRKSLMQNDYPPPECDPLDVDSADKD